MPPKLELVQVLVLPIKRIIPAPENSLIYDAISVSDPEVIDLARSIKAIGVQEPLLVSQDFYLISGHRRRLAAIMARLTTVPVRVYPISRAAQPEAFTKLLVEMNSQRLKNNATLLRESLVKID